MLHSAASLAFTAGGIVMLYMLWHATPFAGKTLNAVVFGSVIDHLRIGSPLAGYAPPCWRQRQACCSRDRKGCLRPSNAWNQAKPGF
jgi:hypothetical protein